MADFFEQLSSARVENVILPMDREREGRIKGIGYVEFPDLESLKAALELNGRDFMRRNIFIDLTQPETAQKMSIMNRTSGGSGGHRSSAPRESTIADQDDSWRGGGGASGGSEGRPNLFGRSSSSGGGRRNYEDRQPSSSSSFEERPPRREREPEGPSFEEKFALQRQKKLEQHQQNRSSGFGSGGSGGRGGGGRGGPRRQHRGDQTADIDENDPLLLATSSQTERPKLQLKERTVPQVDASASATSKSSIFGEGKAWEETDELRNRVEKLAVSEKKTAATTSAPATKQSSPSDDDGFERMVDKKSSYPKKKGMDFSNFNKRGGGFKSSEQSSGAPASTTSTAAPAAEKKQEGGKKQDKPKSDNAWAALSSVDE